MLEFLFYDKLLDLITETIINDLKISNEFKIDDKENVNELNKKLSYLLYEDDKKFVYNLSCFIKK